MRGHKNNNNNNKKILLVVKTKKGLPTFLNAIINTRLANQIHGRDIQHKCEQSPISLYYNIYLALQ